MLPPVLPGGKQDRALPTPKFLTLCIRLYPQYDKSPCCLELDTLLVFGSQKNVPYFQTAFWEVNTVKGYSEHIDRLKDGDLESASWIELNWKNKYWGNRNGNESTERMNTRRADYRAKAAIIDRNIKNMADSTSKVLKNFWKIYVKNDTAKVLITMTASSSYTILKSMASGLSSV